MQYDFCKKKNSIIIILILQATTKCMIPLNFLYNLNKNEVHLIHNFRIELI